MLIAKRNIEKFLSEKSNLNNLIFINKYPKNF